ncbi:MAG TPA: sensor histidine kinase [Capillibacterium sp.]
MAEEERHAAGEGKSVPLTFKEIIKDAVKGGIFGLGISFAFRLALAELPASLWAGLATAAFGIVLGFTLTFCIEYLSSLILFFWPGLAGCLSFYFLLSFAVGFGLFYAANYYFQPFGFEPANLFRVSLAVGIFTAMTGLFFAFTWETKEKIRLEKENKELAILEERNRIARELHDTVVQDLFGLNLHLNAIDYLNEHRPQDLPAAIRRLQEIVTEIQAKMRLMIYELKPAVFMGKSLTEAVEELARLYRTRYNLQVITDYAGQGDQLPGQVQTVLYQVLQAVLNKIAKRGHPSTVRIKLEMAGNGSGRLIIDDDGHGGGKEQNGQDNLGHLEERLKEMNGRMRIEPKTGKGTTITIIF